MGNNREQRDKIAVAIAGSGRYNYLNREEQLRLAEAIIEYLADAVREGANPTSTQRLPDGNFEISMLVLDELVAQVQRKP